MSGPAAAPCCKLLPHLLKHLYPPTLPYRAPLALLGALGVRCGSTRCA